MARRRHARLTSTMISLAAVLLLGGCTEEPESECTGLGPAPGYPQSSAAQSPETALCERYADAAQRIVNGWYRSGPAPKHHPEVIHALRPTPPSSFVMTIESTCTPTELTLTLDLPAIDETKKSAGETLDDIVAALPSRGLAPSTDEIKIVVQTAGGDSATFDPKPQTAQTMQAAQAEPPRNAR